MTNAVAMSVARYCHSGLDPESSSGMDSCFRRNDKNPNAGFHKGAGGPETPGTGSVHKNVAWIYRLSHGFMGKIGFVSAFSVGKIRL
jgi:hypothetical protein